MRVCACECVYLYAFFVCVGKGKRVCAPRWHASAPFLKDVQLTHNFFACTRRTLVRVCVLTSHIRNLKRLMIENMCTRERARALADLFAVAAHTHTCTRTHRTHRVCVPFGRSLGLSYFSGFVKEGERIREADILV